MTDGAALPPGLILIASGLLTLLVPRPVRQALQVGAPVALLGYLWYLAGLSGPVEAGPFAGVDAYVTEAEYLGMQLYPVRADALGMIFAVVFAITSALGGLYALSLDRAKELAALQVYAGSAVGAVLAGDVITLFVFWEVMAIASTIVIWMGGEDARGAGLRYAAIHFLGGALLMAGVAGYVQTTGQTAFTEMPSEGLIAGLVLIAFLVNSGAWPLNAWLPDAYPRASWAGTVFLSAFTTKTAIYTLIRGFPGEEWLLWLGVITMVYGIVYALVESEIRRLLCYAIIAQSGFLLVGAGLGTDMTLNGAAGHAFVSILYSILLFMVAGAVMRQTGRRELSALGGLWRQMPFTALMAVIGGLCISAFPGTGAYVTKSLISSGAGYAGNFAVWLALTAAGVGVVLHAGLRFQWGIFGGDDRRLQAGDPDWAMRAAMGIAAVIVLAIAFVPQSYYAALPHPVDYSPYKAGLLLSQLQLLLGGVLVFFLMLRLMPESRGITLDTDWLYRGAGPYAVRAIALGWLTGYERWADRWIGNFDRLIESLYRFHGPEGALARSRPTGYVALWMTALLCLLLIFIIV